MVRLLFIFILATSVCYGQGNRFAGFGYKSTCDVDAQKYIDSSGITDATQKTAICTYITMLKDSGLYSKILAGYIFTGGSASSTKFNFKDVRQDTSAFTLTYSGGWTYSSSGALANGTNGTANTWLRPNAKLTIRDYAIAVYVNGGTLGGGAAPITVYTFSEGSDWNNSGNGIGFRSTVKYIIPNGEGYNNAAASDNAMTGILVGNVLGSNVQIYKNGVMLATNTTSGGALSTQPFFIAWSGWGGVTYQNIKIGCILITRGLTDSQIKTISNIISIFKTNMGI